MQGFEKYSEEFPTYFVNKIGQFWSQKSGKILRTSVYHDLPSVLLFNKFRSKRVYIQRHLRERLLNDLCIDDGTMRLICELF